jgi:hypothetical protein
MVGHLFSSGDITEATDPLVGSNSVPLFKESRAAAVINRAAALAASSRGFHPTRRTRTHAAATPARTGRQ